MSLVLPVDRESQHQPRFPDEAHRALASLRDGHFWFTYRRAAILRAAAASLAGRETPRVLELGCGDGDILTVLSSRFWAVGLERRLDDLSLARRRVAMRVVAAEGVAPPFARCFDLVGLFDVIEHNENDQGVLRTASSLALPGGWVLLTVPADPRLWSRFDRFAGHYRRYTRAMLVELLEEAGLEIVRIVPLFRLLWPLGRVNALLHEHADVTDPASEYRVAACWNWLLARLLSLERLACGGSERGMGTSWLAVARTPSIRNPLAVPGLEGHARPPAASSRAPSR